MEVWIGAGATIFAAFIAILASWVVAILGKESKISEFRQAWIDALRDDIAEMVGIASFLASGIQSVTKEATTTAKRQVQIVDGETKESYAARLAAVSEPIVDAWFAARTTEFIRIDQLKARVETRLNPNEHARLLQSLMQVDIADPKSVDTRLRRLVLDARQVYRKEWEVVKAGEPAYIALKIWTKRAFFLLGAGVIALIIGGGFYAAHVNRHQPDATAESARSSSGPAPARLSP